MTRSFKINPKYLVLLVLAMIGISFASVPLYDLFCRVTGFGGTVQKVNKPSTTVLINLLKLDLTQTSVPTCRLILNL